MGFLSKLSTGPSVDSIAASVNANQIQPNIYEGSVNQNLFYLIYTARQGRYSTSLLSIKIPNFKACDFSIFKKDTFYKIVSALHLVNHIKTGNKDFDKKFIVLSNKNSCTPLLFSDPKLLEIITRFFYRGATKVACLNGCLEIVMPRVGSSIDDVSIMLNSADALKKLCDTNPCQYHTQLPAPLSFSSYRGAFLFKIILAIPVGLVLFFLFYNDHTILDSTNLYYYDNPITIVVVLLWSVYGYRRYKKNLDFKKYIVSILIVALMTFICAYQAAEKINEYLDKSAVTPYVVTIENKLISRTRNYHEYILYTTSWRGRQSEYILTSKEIYEAATIGSEAIIHTRQGFLSAPYVQDVQLK